MNRPKATRPGGADFKKGGMVSPLLNGLMVLLSRVKPKEEWCDYEKET
jgi:hypothetical protein